MQIVIPMSGFGERFRRAGYRVPKPLIQVEGKPIIKHVVDLFPDEQNVTFICNREHLDAAELALGSTLRRIRPEGQIVGIDPHKFGPVHAVLQAAEYLEADEPTIVNYCDFTCYWDYSDFQAFVQETRCDGAIPAYRGFHPHSLGTTNYAYIREEDGWVLDIQEKQPFTDNRMNEFASSGTYYFASAENMLSAMEEQVVHNLSVRDEFYTSLTYRPLIDRGSKIAVYPLQHFMQWGTPEDLNEYLYWSHVFHQQIQSRLNDSSIGNVVIPMAGMGSRFSNVGISTPKPLIEISGRPMMLQAVQGNSAEDRYVFVVRGDMSGLDEVAEVVDEEFPHSVIEVVNTLTAGQAISAQIGVSRIPDLGDPEAPVTVLAVDHGLLYDPIDLQSLMLDTQADVIVWGSRGFPPAIAHPHMYGWIDATDGRVSQVSVKEPLENPKDDLIVVGAFTFRDARTFHACVDRMVARNGTINGEFYMDECVNDAISLGFDCRVLEMHAYVSWGAPVEVETYKYWQSTFHKWEGHDYQLDRDPSVPPSLWSALDQEFRLFTASRPAQRGEASDDMN